MFEGNTNGVNKFAINSYTEWGEVVHFCMGQHTICLSPCALRVLSVLPAAWAACCGCAESTCGCCWREGARGRQGALGHVHKASAVCVQTLRCAIPWSTLPVLPPAALPELVTSFLSSLKYFTSKPGLLSPKILALSKFSLRSRPSASASCSPSVASACRSL